MGAVRLKILALVLLLSWGTCWAQAQSVTSPSAYGSSGQKMKSFLLACGLGTAAGASLGAASLAFIGDPSDNLQNIAKGASLGLYAGILWGYYNVVLDPAPLSGSSEAQQELHWLIQPDFKGNQVDGAKVGYVFSAP